jgi:hypothetical protein
MRVLFGGVKVWRRIKARVFLKKGQKSDRTAGRKLIVGLNGGREPTAKICP